MKLAKITAVVFGVLVSLSAAGLFAEEAAVCDSQKTDAQWRAELTPEQYRIMREKGTERAFSGHLVHNKAKGSYTCAACGAELFSSDAKFDSGTGWPSFDSTANQENIILREDLSHGMKRTEVVCKACGGHLGHLFKDGPTETGDRYCINSAALAFAPAAEKP